MHCADTTRRTEIGFRGKCVSVFCLFFYQSWGYHKEGGDSKEQEDNTGISHPQAAENDKAK